MRKLLFLLVTMALSACAVGPDYRQPDSPAPDVFAAAAEAAFATDEIEPQFWKLFQDAGLDRLVTQALAANHDIRIAEANLRRVRALRTESRFDLAPTITAGGGRTQAKASERQLQELPATDRTIRYYDAGFDAAWELDIFGRIRRGVEARNADLGAAEASLDDIGISVAAEVARNYFELRGLQRQLAVAQRNADNQRSTLELTQVRLDAGRGTELDTTRARAQLASTLAAIPDFEGAVNRAIFRLGVLSGRLPEALLDELKLPQTLPGLPALQHIGTPEALLRRRPDVRVAERELASATARIGLAVGDLFPKISFGGSFGYDAAGSADLGSAGSETYGFGPSISWAAFDLGRVRQRIKASQASADGALARYEQAVLLALEDTESSLTTYSRSRARQEHLRSAAQASAQAAELARLRFDGGVADFLDVLDAQRTVLGAESELARSETATATAMVAVYKALGGGVGQGGWAPTSPRS